MNQVGFRMIGNDLTVRIGANHRSRKKWRPQREQRKGKRIQWIALSMAFRTPTALKSIDLHFGQWGENIAFSSLTP